MSEVTSSGTTAPQRPHVLNIVAEMPDSHWGGWVPDRRIGSAAADLAVGLSEGPQARAAVRRSVEVINADSLHKGSIVLSNVIWVPDRQRGEVAAIGDVTLIETSGGAEAPARYLARNLRKDFGWTTRLVEYAADTSEVPGGPMTIEQVLLRRFGERRVQAYLFLNVFPPGAEEAVSLVFNTVHLDLVTDIARQGRLMAESLQIELGEIPGGRRKA